jgi:phytoene dehydrogenase-like protein
VNNKAGAGNASQKNLGSAYEALSYAEAVRLNHGQALHERYIEPFLRKLLNVSSAEVLARYHRAAWVPLFHPETLTRSLRGESVNLPEYPFWVPDQGHVGALVSHLIARLVADGVRVVSQPLSHLKFEGGRWTVGTQDGAAWSAPQMVLGVTPERARSLIGLPPLAPPSGASVALLMARVKSSAIGQGCACLMVVDEGYAAYRLTDQDALAGRDPAWHREGVELPRILVRDSVRFHPKIGVLSGGSLDHQLVSRPIHPMTDEQERDPHQTNPTDVYDL